MAKTYLLEASPRNKTTAATTAIRIAGGGSRAYTHKGFNDWRSGLASRPLFSTSIEFDQNGFSGGAIPNVATLEIRSYDGAWLDTLSNGLHWKDADFTLSSGDDASAVPTWTVEIVGRVSDIRRKDGTISLTVVDKSGETDVPVLVRRFAGTGTIEGDSAAAGRICRRTWGSCFNIEGLPLVAASNVYEFGDLNFPLNAIADVRDKGRPASSYFEIAWQGSVAATYATLAASTPPQGGCVRAPSIACVKWWTDPVGPLTADISGEVGTGYVEGPVQIAARILTARTSLAISNLSDAHALRAVSAGLHVDSEGETVGQALDRLLRGVSLVWVVLPSGQIFINEIKFGSPAESLRAHDVERVRAYKPVRLRKLGYQRNHRIHSAGEISAALLLDDGRIFQDVLDSGGLKGDSSYTWFAYADSADGSVNFTNGAPGGRIFLGIAQNKTTATESTNPADYQWSLYRGPATFGLVNFNGNSIVGPNFAQKIAGSVSPTWGEASVYSSENFRGGAQTSFTFVTGQEVMAGLNTDPLTTSSYTDIDYAFHLDAGGNNVNIFENGTYIQSVGALVPGTVMQIVYNNKTVKYLYGATLAREVPAPPDLRLYFDTAIAPIGGRIENITFAAAGKAGDDGTDGIDGTDGTDGTDGQQGASTNVVYLKSASQPSTPGASPGVPSGWYDSSGSLPAGSDPIWISFGVKPIGSANFTWQYPVPAAAADLRLWMGLDTDGSVKPNQVATDAMQTAAVFDSSDAFGSSGSINGSPVAIASVTRTPAAAGSKFIVMVSGTGTLDADNATSTTLAFNLDGPAGSIASGIVARNDAGRPKPYSAIRTFTPGSLSPQTFTLYANRNVSTGSLGTLSGTIVILEAKKVV